MAARSSLVLQWSHVFSDMVSAGMGAEPQSRSPASMEPCLFRHGKEHYLRLIADQPTASMEPCLFRHGKHLVPGEARRY